MGAKDILQAPWGYGQNEQDLEDVRHTSAGCSIGPELPKGFKRQAESRQNKAILSPWQWNRIYPGDPFRLRSD